MNYFGFKAPTRSGPLHERFDFHQNVCDDMTRNAEASEDIVPKLAPHFELKLREKLDFFSIITH